MTPAALLSYIGGYMLAASLIGIGSGLWMMARRMPRK